MKKGRISRVEPAPIEVGLITPDGGGTPILFTARVFSEDWLMAIVRRQVEYDLYVGTNEAKRVIGL